MLASALSCYEYGGAEKIATRLWPQDRDVPVLMKAASAPADTVTSGWASQLAQTSIADLVLTLGGATCAGELMRRGMALQLENNAQINCPSIVSAASDSAWVAQGSPFPIRQLVVNAGASLTPKRLASGFVLTREITEYSTPVAEALIRACVSESIAIGIDSAMFDASAASTSRPAGLRNGVSTLTATAGGTVDALRKDLGQLVQAVAGVVGNNVAIVAAPDCAAKILTQVGPQFPYPVFASSGLASGFVMAVALPALASAISQIRFETSGETVVHMEDISPLAIAPSATPITAPLRSAFQTDCVAFRLILEVSWGLRAANAVAWTSAVTW